MVCTENGRNDTRCHWHTSSFGTIVDQSSMRRSPYNHRHTAQSVFLVRQAQFVFHCFSHLCFRSQTSPSIPLPAWLPLYRRWMGALLQKLYNASRFYASIQSAQSCPGVVGFVLPQHHTILNIILTVFQLSRQSNNLGFAAYCVH